MKTSIITSITLPAMFVLCGTIGLNAQTRSENNAARAARGSNSVQQSSSDSRGGNSAPAVQSGSRGNGGGSQQSNVTVNRGSGSRESYRNNDRGGNRGNTIVVKGNREIKHYPRENTVIVTNRPERRVTEVHTNYHRISYRGVDYSYDNGRYYRVNNGAYIVTTPPRGIRVSIIPTGFLTLMVGTLPYYYYGGVYYREVASSSYEVVDAPMGAIVPELPADDVRAVVIGGKTYFEYDNILYKPVVTSSGVQYKVIGALDDVR